MDEHVASSFYQYDGMGRLTTLTHSTLAVQPPGWGADTLGAYELGYDAASRVTSIHSAQDGPQNYYYDSTNQLQSVVSGDVGQEYYQYDANGNRTNANQSIGPNNQLLSDGTYNYAYDAEGNLKLKDQPRHIRRPFSPAAGFDGRSLHNSVASASRA